MATEFQGPSATRFLSPNSSLRLFPADIATVLTPDLNYGSNWTYVDPLNAVDGSDTSYAGANAGGGSGSPSYKPAIRFIVDPDDLGQSQVVGCQIIYKWTNNNDYASSAGARLDLYWQTPTHGVANQWDHRLIHQRDALLFLDDVKRTEQFHFEQVTKPIAADLGTTYLTLVHQSGISGSSNLTLLIYDVQFLIQDRIDHINQG